VTGTLIIVAPGSYADIAVTKTVSNAAPVVGDEDVYTIAAHNNGPLAATGVTVTDVLPNGVVFVSATASQGAYDPASGLWTVGSLAVGGTATLHITVRLAATGVIRNTATKSGETQIDPVPANNASSVTIAVASAPTPPVPSTGAGPESTIPAGLGQGIALFGVLLCVTALVLRRRTLTITTSRRSAVSVPPAVSPRDTGSPRPPTLALLRGRPRHRPRNMLLC
jgi:uncharacterized repeat protein (TIGR01451 family)